MHLAINGWFWDQPNTGSGQYLRNLLPAMCSAEPDLRVTLVTPRPVPACDAPEGVVLRLVQPRGRGHLGKVWFEQRGFPAAARGADLAHVPYWGPPLRSPVPFAVTVHDIIPLLLPAYRGGLMARLYTAMVSAAVRGAAVVLTDSDVSRQDIIARLRLPAGRVRTVYLAAASAFTPDADPAEDEAVRRKYDLPDSFVLYLGGFDVRKNVGALVQAYAYVRDAVAGVPLLLAGKELDGSVRRFPAVRPLIEALELGDVVRFTGWIDEADKPALLRLADCFVFPSRYEGFGLPPLEAMACGTPVVCADASSLPEVVGDAGFLVDPDDTRAMAGAIIAVLTEPSLADTLRARGLEQARRFSWVRATQETLAAYAAI
jgi:glycosyltransferase involved in cell wall biosynthesis